MTAKPTTETLIAFVLGDLEPAQSAEVQAALAADTAPARLVAEIRSMVALLRDNATITPPADLVAHLKALFDARPLDVPAGFDTDVEGVLGELVTDTRNEALMGYRGQLSAYQLTFEAGAAEVHLQITPIPGQPSSMQVRGQIEPETDGPIESVRFVPVTDGPTIDTAADDTGFFSADVPVGVYDMHISVGGQTFVLPAVEIG